MPPRGPARRVRFYEKPGCHLCEEALRAVARVQRVVALEVERIDIERRPELFERYALRIPVLSDGERELDAAGLDERALGAWLAAG